MVVPLHTVVSGPSENSDKDIIGCVVSRTKEMSSRTGDGKLLLNCALNVSLPFGLDLYIPVSGT